MKKSKFLNNLIIIVIAVLALGTIAQAANIVWVSDRVPPKGYDPNLVPEAGFLELLRNAGYTVDYKGEVNSFEWVGPEDDPELSVLSDELRYWRELDDNKIAELEAADLIIFSRLASSGAYDDTDGAGYDERILWNSITTPMICMNPHLTRTGYDKWGWMDYVNTATLWNDATGSMPVNPHVSTVLDLTHAIFAGIDLSDPTQVKLLIDDYNCEGGSAASIGNGTLLLTRNVDLAVMIATWEAGVEFFDGVGYFAGGPRMFFAAGAGAKSAEFQGSFGDGDYNLTPDGETVFLNAVKYMLPATSIGVHRPIDDMTYKLMQNYPNPFNPNTNIRFQIPKDGHVTISVYNSLGQQVATLVDRNLKSGVHRVTFDAAKYSSGIYLYKIQAADFMQVKKMILLK